MTADFQQPLLQSNHVTLKTGVHVLKYENNLFYTVKITI